MGGRLAGRRKTIPEENRSSQDNEVETELVNDRGHKMMDLLGQIKEAEEELARLTASRGQSRGSYRTRGQITEERKSKIAEEIIREN